MSDTNNDNSSKQGFSISFETIAKGAIRVKTKIWIDNLELDKGTDQAVELYKNTLTKLREQGFIIDGDNNV